MTTAPAPGRLGGPPKRFVDRVMVNLPGGCRERIAAVALDREQATADRARTALLRELAADEARIEARNRRRARR